MTTKKDIKQIDKYKAFFKQSLEEGGDFVNLVIELNKELHLLIKSAVINQTTNTSTFLGLYDDKNNRVLLNYERYKVKNILYGCMYHEFKDVLFLKEFVDSGKYTFKFSNLEYLEKFKSAIKDNMFLLIKNILSADLQQSVVYTLNIE